jgi:peptidoglycan hydrolase-like protein with peptidoglycan-binding domain
VGNDGPKAEDTPEPEKLGDRDLRRGCKGDDVKELQNDLMKLGYSLQKYGADGDFGGETEKAVRAFQLDHGLLADGVMQEDDFKALFDALDGDAPAPVVQNVEITGNSVNVRSGPGTNGTRVLGVVHKGDRLPYQGETRSVDGRDWYLVEYSGQNGWVSSKYASLV